LTNLPVYIGVIDVANIVTEPEKKGLVLRFLRASSGSPHRGGVRALCKQEEHSISLKIMMQRIRKGLIFSLFQAGYLLTVYAGFKPGSDATPPQKLFMINIGINNYEGLPYSFNNCVNDAQAYEKYFIRDFQKLWGKEAESRMVRYQLLNEKATRANILAALNDVISRSGPEDAFVFSFSGFSYDMYRSDSSVVTLFAPYDAGKIPVTWGTPVAESADLMRRSISLNNLKDLLQLVPANRQLFVSEAGTTENFRLAFLKAVVSEDPRVARLSSKNRVLIFPEGMTFDDCVCRTYRVKNGPICHFLTSMPDSLNVFDVFEEGMKAERFIAALRNREIQCNAAAFRNRIYMGILQERKYVDELIQLFPYQGSGDMPMRGGKTRSAGLPDTTLAKIFPGKKRALVIGNGSFKAAEHWDDLPNATLDALSVARVLKDEYGFETDTLLDATREQIEAALIYLSKTLGNDDQLFIYVASHGDFDSALLDDGFLVCRNSNFPELDPLRNSYLRYSTLERLINRLPAKHTLLVLDVCFGASFDNTLTRCKETRAYAGEASGNFLQAKSRHKTRLFISSGSYREVPDGYSGQHSPFAIRLLEALRGRGGEEGFLTATDLFRFVHKLPAEPRLGSFGDNQCGSEFVFLPAKR
jgi:hypothetical protein